MAQAKTMTLVLTPKQMDAFLEAYVCKAALKEAKKKLLAFQSSEKAQKSSKLALKKQNSTSDFSKMKAADVEAMAKKKAKKEKREIECKGKKPTKAENIDYLTDGGNTTDSSKKDKKDKKDKKALKKFCEKVNDPKKMGTMNLFDLKEGAKMIGFSKCSLQEVRTVAKAKAKQEKVKIPSKTKQPTKVEYLAFATGKVNGIEDKVKAKNTKKGKGGKISKSDCDSEEDTSDCDEDSSSCDDCDSDSDLSSDLNLDLSLDSDSD